MTNYTSEHIEAVFLSNYAHTQGERAMKELTARTIPNVDPYKHIYSRDFFKVHELLTYLEENPTYGYYECVEDFMVFHILKEHMIDIG